MSDDDLLQKNIQRTAAAHALKQVRAMAEAEEVQHAKDSKAARWIVAVGIVVALISVALLIRSLGGV
ncbi:MAG: hypothetical protein PHP57_05570 [Sideroxydans sp.]|nr:hypothetical protein [Sideroxydans sp.]